MLRRWISALAMISMLAHATLIVRHHAMMTGAQLATQITASVLAQESEAKAALTALVGKDVVICKSHSNSTPTGKEQSKQGMNCPLCAAPFTELAVFPGDFAAPIVFSTLRTGQIVERDQRVDVVSKLRPPSRAPPISALV